MVYLVRTPTGHLYHDPNCRRAGPNPLKWYWAEDMSLGEVFARTVGQPERVQPGPCCLGKVAPVEVNEDA